MQQMDPQPSGQQGPMPSAVAKKKRQRVYQHWQGNERFFCWGYFVAGPNWKASLGTALLISAPAGIFLAFVAPYMAVHVHVIVLVISCILPALAVWFLMMTACRDPGVIPRQEPDQEYLSATKPRTKEVYVNNQRVVIRYNDTCHFYQPPRAHHCSVNDNCIERFDHHCPWVGTTIGLRNYRTFLLFVYTSTVLCLYVFGLCVAMLFVKHDQLVEESDDASGLWGKTLGKCVPALALMGYTFLFFWFVGGLSLFHAYLVATNQTTYENFRYNHDNRPNPYSRGCLRNCAEVWCTPVPPSKVQFRAFVDEFKPPTGQPFSPYLNGSGQGHDGVGGQEQSGGSGGAGYGDDHVASSIQPPQHAVMPPQHPHSGAAGGALGGGYGYGQAAQSGGGAAYDPAALQAPGQQYGMPYGHGQRYDTELGGSITYSDAGAGWAGGAGPLNEPPAQVKSPNAFTSQTGSPRPGLGPNGSPRAYSGSAGGFGTPPPAMAPGGHAGGYVDAANHYHQDDGSQAYYGDQYDMGTDGYDEYDLGEEDERGNVHNQHVGAVRAEHVRPTLVQ